MKKITLLIFLMLSTLGFSQPTTSAPVPTKLPADVISIYGGSYTNIATNYNPGWGQSGTVNTAFDPGDGNLCMAYTNFNYQGTELTTTNASGMEYIHIDIWTSTATNVKVSPINNGTGAGEFLVNVPLVQSGWSSVDIPKSSFTGMTWNSVFQIKFDGQGGTTPSTIYLDNIYFWKATADPLKDATLSDLKVDGTTISGFGSSTTSYTYSVPNGTVIVPQVTSATTTNGSATKVITQASAIPGSATVLVTSADASTTKTYTVSIVAVGPPTAAPTPPARNAADVKSIYSDAYTPIATLGYTGDVDTYNTSWCPGVTTEVMIAGNKTHKITGLGCEGVAFQSGRFNATGFTHFHMDIYTDSPTMDKSFNIKFSNWNGGSGEANAIEFSLTNASNPALPNPNSGTWISLDIPLANWTAGSRNDLVQFVISSDLGTVYYDNLYLHKNTVLGTEEFETSSVKLYPNPVKNTLTIEANASIDKVSVYNILGQEVLKASPNSNTATLQTNELPKGVYMVTTEIEGKLSTSKVVKE